jgi:hypothetical protein
MKFWNAFLLILLLAVPSLAQAPYYGYPFFGYPPRDIFYPYLTYPNYTYPYYTYPNYLMPQYYLQPPTVGPILPMNTDLILNVQDNMQRLTNEMQRLENEMAAAQSPPAQVYVVDPQQPAPAPEKAAEPAAPAREKAAEPTPLARPYALIFKDGRQIDGQGYVIAGDTLWFVTPENSMKFPLSEIDVEATQRENLKRGIEFPDV